MPNVSREQRTNGLVAVDGLIAGEIRGTVNGMFRGTIDGEVDVRLLSGRVEEMKKEAATEGGKGHE